MRISLYDSWNGKFSRAFQKHWESLGHTVHFNPRWEDVLDVDLNFFYQSDNALIKGTKEIPLKGKIYAQCVDIEVWAGQPFAVDWSRVSGCMFMAQHIKDNVENGAPDILKIPRKLIKPGIDVDKFTLRPPVDFVSTPLRRVAYVVGSNRIWDVKRLDIAFQLIRDLVDKTGDIWQLHIRGTYSTHAQYNAYCKHLEKDLKLEGNVVWYEDRVEDLNTWLDDKDYMVLPSTKEVFSYITAECMAKGIKPVIGNWESARDTWGPYICETYGQMLERFLENTYNPTQYRNYVLNRYDEKRYLKEVDEFLGIGGEQNG
jgi:hypothetical protein